jgi:hypothetical protein
MNITHLRILLMAPDQFLYFCLQSNVSKNIW